MEHSKILSDKGIFLLSEHIDSTSCAKAIEFILEANAKATSDIKYLRLIINSGGGDLFSGFALCDIMLGSKLPIHTYGLGIVGSAALLIFMTGTPGYRTLTPNTSVLSHQYSWGSTGKEHELFATVKEFELTSDRVLNHYKHCTKLSKKEIVKYLLPAQDVWLSAQDAVKLGLADNIRVLNVNK